MKNEDEVRKWSNMIEHYNNERIRKELILSKLLKDLANINGAFECAQCAMCCNETTPGLFYPEIMHFENHSKMLSSDKIYWDENVKEYRLKNPCPFLNLINNKINNKISNKISNKYECKTQKYKPLACKIYPFSLGHKDMGSLTIILCPLGAEIYNFYLMYCKEIDKDVTYDKMKWLYKGDFTDELIIKRDKLFAEFKGNKVNVAEAAKKTLELDIQMCLPIDMADIEGLAKRILREQKSIYKEFKEEIKSKKHNRL